MWEKQIVKMSSQNIPITDCNYHDHYPAYKWGPIITKSESIFTNQHIVDVIAHLVLRGNQLFQYKVLQKKSDKTLEWIQSAAIRCGTFEGSLMPVQYHPIMSIMDKKF